MEKTEEVKTPKKTKKTKDFIAVVGRRKTAVASVFLYQEKGDFIVNGKPIQEVYSTEKDILKWTKPFHVIGVSHPGSQFRATIVVKGAGKPSQLSAVTHGLSRALAEISEENGKLLRKQGLLTRDPRMVERKKYFLRKARKAPQYSKR